MFPVACTWIYPQYSSNLCCNMGNNKILQMWTKLPRTKTKNRMRWFMQKMVPCRMHRHGWRRCNLGLGTHTAQVPVDCLLHRERLWGYRDKCREAFATLKIMTLPSVYIFENLQFVRRRSNFQSREEIHYYNARNKNNLVPMC